MLPIENRKLTVKQKAFADFYIKTGNATESAIKGGYSKNTAAVIGHENLRKPNILKYIEKRQKKIDEKRIADGDEVLEVLTSLLRSEDIEPRDRIRSADLIGKRWQLWSPKLDANDEALEKLDEILKTTRESAENANN